MLLSLTDAKCSFPSLNDNNGEIICSALDAYVCRGINQSFGEHTYNVTKENEGAFKCCCEETCSCYTDINTAPIDVYGES